MHNSDAVIFSPSLFGIPLVVSCTSTTTCTQLYKMVWEQVTHSTRLLSPTPTNSSSQHVTNSCHNMSPTPTSGCSSCFPSTATRPGSVQPRNRLRRQHGLRISFCPQGSYVRGQLVCLVRRKDIISKVEHQFCSGVHGTGCVAAANYLPQVPLCPPLPRSML